MFPKTVSYRKHNVHTQYDNHDLLLQFMDLRTY